MKDIVVYSERVALQLAFFNQKSFNFVTRMIYFSFTLVKVRPPEAASLPGQPSTEEIMC